MIEGANINSGIPSGMNIKDQIKGQIISGKFGEIIARQKSDSDFELGEIVVAEDSNAKFFLQVYDIQYGSQISKQNLELISGLNLEEDTTLEFMDKNMRNYKIAVLKNLITIAKIGEGRTANSSSNNASFSNNISLSKSLPSIFTNIRTIEKSDIDFLTKPKNSFFIGYLRTGSKYLDAPIYLNGVDVLTHHILISGTTGKGKSVLMSNILWDCTGQDYCSLLVLDPHDEYFGRINSKIGLKDHPSGKVVYYTSKNPPQGARTLKINIKTLRPQNFGCLDFTDPQEQAMNAFYREYGDKWVEAIILEKPVKVNFIDATINVLKRRLMYLLDLDYQDSQLFCKGIFDIAAGESTIKNICDDLENRKTVIIDTSSFSGQIELLIGSLVSSEVFSKYKRYKLDGVLKDKPVVSIVLEEAPRVLGKDVLEKGSNIFSTIAREGRKFNVGLIAITQLPSLIPREILANMNTKIILGTDMVNERQAIIDSASQDLTSDSRAIASLDKGECIVSTNFSRFALPIKIPYFDEWAKKDIEKYAMETKENSQTEERIQIRPVSKPKPAFQFSGIDILNE